MHLVAVLHCLVPHYTYNSCHALPAIIQLQGGHLMQQFSGVGVWMHHKISYMHPF